MEETTYNYEFKTLKREESLKEQIVEGYKNKLIKEVLESGDILKEDTVLTVPEPPKKSFWKRLFDVL